MLQKRLDADLEYVSVMDPAINADDPACDLDKYRETGDRKYAPLKEGATPTVFVLRGLSRDALMPVIKGFSASAQWERIEAFETAVKYGLKRVRNFVGKDGKDVELRFEQTPIGEALTKDALEEIYDVALVVELGGRIQEASRVHPLS